MSYFPPYGNSKNEIQVELDLSNYATKSDFRNVTGIDTSWFAKKDDLVHLKSEFDKLDIGKVETSLTDLSKLNNVVKDEVVKKAKYNKLNELKVNDFQTVDTSNLVEKTDYNTKIGEWNKKFDRNIKRGKISN